MEKARKNKENTTWEHKIKMTKCFQCIKAEYHKKIKWSQVMDATVILQGTGYCYEHLKKEIGWDEKHE